MITAMMSAHERHPAEKTKLLAIAFAIGIVGGFVAGCGPNVIVMQNPQTHEVAQCKHDPWGSLARADVAQCVDGYEKAGWVRM